MRPHRSTTARFGGRKAESASGRAAYYRTGKSKRFPPAYFIDRRANTMRQYRFMRDVLQKRLSLAGNTQNTKAMQPGGFSMSRSTSHPLFITALFALMVTACAEIPTFPTQAEREAVEARAYKARHEKADAVFDERCKSAGQKIYRTAENVEGVFLVDLRQQADHIIAADQNWPDAGMPEEFGGEEYIAGFLYFEHPFGQPPRAISAESRGRLLSRPSEHPGYRYVDVKEADNRIVRYTLKPPAQINPLIPTSKLVGTLLNGPPARYAISRTNHINPADRAMWIAGVTITITDTQTNEVMATSTGYSFEPGLATLRGAWPVWTSARTCPLSLMAKPYATRFFVDQVLKIKPN